MNKLILIIMMALTSVVVQAQDAAAPAAPAAKAAAPVKKQQVKVNFGEDELIKGSNPTPEVEFIFEKANFNYKKLIRLREHFIPEADGGREGFGARE